MNRFHIMKRLPVLTAFLFWALLAVAVGADAPGAAQQQDQQVLAVAKEVQTQQIAIAENQGKIDAKLATIAEYLRVARIWAGRGGKK
jgi:type IV pilus biogenesis protein CpaD/CtpE